MSVRWFEGDKINQDLSGEHEDGEAHNYGLAQQVELSHLTDSFMSEYLAEIMRWSFGTGVVGVRQYANNPAFRSDQRRFHASYAALNIHDHSNYLGMPGLGEIALMANGYYYRSRHNDYKTRKSVIADADTFGTELVNGPDIKASVLAKPTGVSGDVVDVATDTQAKYFKEIYENNPEDVVVQLAYAEVWVETNTGQIVDAGDSFRHADAISDVSDALSRAVKYNAEGVKNFLENESFGASRTHSVSETGASEVGYLNFRIMTCDVGNLADVGGAIVAPIITIATASSHVHQLDAPMTDQQANDLVNAVVTTVTLSSTDNSHTHNYDITWDGTKFVGVDTNVDHQHEVLISQLFTGNIPFSEAEAREGIVSSSNRFSLIHDYWDGVKNKNNVMSTRWPRFSCLDLENICEKVPGMDGEGAFIAKTNPNNDTISYSNVDGGQQNAAYYHRRYGRDINDAAGRSVEDAGLNDPALFVAKNTKNGVVNGISYMIPIELLLRSPIEKWNPYQIALSDKATIDASAFDGTQALPYQGYAPEQYYYLIPYAFYSDSNPNSDPADTNRSSWMLSGIDATARRCWGSGIKPFTADGLQRIRIPVYALAQEGGAAYGEVNRLKDLVKARGRDRLSVADEVTFSMSGTGPHTITIAFQTAMTHYRHCIADITIFRASDGAYTEKMMGKYVVYVSRDVTDDTADTWHVDAMVVAEEGITVDPATDITIGPGGIVSISADTTHTINDDPLIEVDIKVH